MAEKLKQDNFEESLFNNRAEENPQEKEIIH